MEPRLTDHREAELHWSSFDFRTFVLSLFNWSIAKKTGKTNCVDGPEVSGPEVRGSIDSVLLYSYFAL